MVLTSMACWCAEMCSANITCGGGPFPVAPNLACQGFNPEGADLGTTARCATNAYDNNGYLTLDFTCSASTCLVDSDCPLVMPTPMQKQIAGFHPLQTSLGSLDQDACNPWPARDIQRGVAGPCLRVFQH